MSVGVRRGWVFALPWIIGLSVFMLYPFFAAIYYSFTDFSVLLAPKWIGLRNFEEMSQDTLFWKALGNTLIYAAMAITSTLLLSLGLALMMNGVRKGQTFYSVLFYLPQLVPPTVTAILFMWIFNGEFGLLNYVIQPIVSLFDAKGSPPSWLSSEWALRSIVMTGLWGIGQSAFIYLAKLQDVPQDLYEAAEIDGASTAQKIWHVTLPTISPLIFFNIIMGIIGAFQVFTEPWIMTQGGPDRATTFLPQYIYENAFENLRMGYACAVAWVLFMIVLGLTIFSFWMSRNRVHYAAR